MTEKPALDPSPAPDDAPLAAAPAGRPAPDLRPGPARVVVAVVLGLEANDLERATATAAAVPDVVPVFLTDAEDFTPFLRQGFAFASLPPGRLRATAPDLAWEDHARALLAALEEEWAAERSVAFGREARELLRRRGR